MCKDNAPPVSPLDKDVRRDNRGSVSRRKPSLHNQVVQDLFIATTPTTFSSPLSNPTSPDEVFFKAASTSTTITTPQVVVVVVGHGRTLREYNGFPKPPATRGPLPPLIFAANEIVWLTEMNGGEKEEDEGENLLEDSKILRVT